MFFKFLSLSIAPIWLRVQKKVPWDKKVKLSRFHKVVHCQTVEINWNDGDGGVIASFNGDRNTMKEDNQEELLVEISGRSLSHSQNVTPTWAVIKLECGDWASGNGVSSCSCVPHSLLLNSADSEHQGENDKLGWVLIRQSTTSAPAVYLATG